MGRKSKAKKARSKEKLVAFVCTANVCRSPMAEKLFEDGLAKSKSKKKIRVLSAGLTAVSGDKASGKSVEALEEIGLDISGHRSATLTRAMLQEASAVFCMTESHRVLMHMYFDLPEDANVFLLRDFLNASDKEVPDPFGQSIEIYRECREKMLEAMPPLLEWVEENL